MRNQSAGIRRLCNLVLLVVVVSSAAALAQQDKGPDVSIDTAIFQYPEPVAALSKIDFKNMNYPVNGDVIELRNGVFRKDDEEARAKVELGDVWRFGSHALVSIDFLACGGSCSDDGLLFLFAIDQGHPVITQRFRYDAQIQGAGQSFDPASRRLTIKARSGDATAHCCPKHMDIATYRWAGDKFELEKSERVPVSSK